jgi:hypothetical protein
MEIKLNLIPPAKKEEIRKNNQLKMAIRTEVILTIALAVFFAVLLSFKYILNISFAFNSAAWENENPEQFKKIENYDRQFSNINTQVFQIITLKKSQLYWSEFFTKLDALVFSGISVKKISTDDYSIMVEGISDTRDDLILFKEKIESEKCFTDVDLPLSNLVGRNNVEFQISFNIDKNCLKKR